MKNFKNYLLSFTLAILLVPSVSFAQVMLDAYDYHAV